MSNDNKVEWCNWVFNECLTPKQKWLVERDCSSEITLSRGDGRNYKAYNESLKPTYQYAPPPQGSKCPNCHKYVNGVNPSDDGETWIRK